MDRRKILVLDDDPIVALSCKRMLEAEGFYTSTIDRGQHAIEMFGREHFDLLISDIRLPDISGMTVIKEARTTQPEMDVVVITGYPVLNDAKDSIRLGAVEYIEKPFTPDFLINVVKRTFDKKNWVLKQAFIGELNEYIISLRETGLIYYKDGIWSRQAGDEPLEIYCDVRYWLLGGELVYIDFIKGIAAVKAGEPFARLLTSSGNISDLPSPATGRIKELATEVNDVVPSLMKSHLTDGWLLRLAKIFPY